MEALKSLSKYHVSSSYGLADSEDGLLAILATAVLVWRLNEIAIFQGLLLVF